MAKRGVSLRRSGFFAGYYRTPVLTFSSTIISNPELSALQGIQANTEEDGAMVRGLTKVIEDSNKIGK